MTANLMTIPSCLGVFLHDSKKLVTVNHFINDILYNNILMSHKISAPTLQNLS
jgi:hypothetical protein